MIRGDWCICAVVLDDSTLKLKWTLIWNIMLCGGPKTATYYSRKKIPEKLQVLASSGRLSWVSPRGLLQTSYWLVSKHERPVSQRDYESYWISTRVSLVSICPEYAKFQRSTFQPSEWTFEQNGQLYEQVKGPSEALRFWQEGSMEDPPGHVGSHVILVLICERVIYLQNESTIINYRGLRREMIDRYK